MLRVFFAILIFFVALIGARWFIGFTPPIMSAGSVSFLGAVDINGDRQFLLVRGRDKEKPILLFLHGGPGMPAMYLGHRFQRPLEKEFVVVHWDQRASGKSFRKGIDPALISTTQLLSDAEAVVSHLQQRYGAEKIYLAGHSHGSYLGAILAARRPDLFHAYIGIGQVTDFKREIEVQNAYLKTQLSSLGLPPDTEITSANSEDLLFQTGSELYGETSFMPLIMAGLTAPEYSLSDVMKVKSGSSFSSANMKRDAIDGELMDEITQFDIPVIMMMGKHDMVTPTSLAKEYFDLIEAPSKRWVIFDQSAHFPFFEEPEKFAGEMKKLLAE